MQLKLLSFTLFSVAVLARASAPFDIDVDSLATREWDDDVLERGFNDWDEDLLKRDYDDWDDLDARDFLYDDEDFAGLEARSDEIDDLGEFTTRELSDELSERIFEARAKIPGGAAPKGSKKKGSAGTPGLKSSKKRGAVGTLASSVSLPGGPADGKLGVPAPASPTDLPSGSGVPALPSVSGGKLTGAAEAKANLQKLLAMLEQIKAKHGAAGGKGATGAKIDKPASLGAKAGKKGGAKSKPPAQSGSKRKSTVK